MSGGGTKTSSGTEDTVLATDAPDTRPEQRSSLPTIPPPPDARYRLGQELGRGGMGRVVEAFDTHLQRTVALKEVLPKAGNIERRFQREVRITARLEHASIVPVYDSGRLGDGRPFYVMRRVSGKPLDEVIARARTLEDRLALLPNVLSAIEAVAHAHRRGVVHRDLKPQNILVGELGETVVIDWGLAKVIGDSEEIHDSLEPKLPSAADSLQTQVGSVFGTPGFMSPEQARGDDLGAPADVYALGATLYQMVAGKPPFGGTSATDVISSTLRHRMQPIATAAPGAPAELVTIIEKALAFEPKDRYGDAGELAEDVRRFLTGQLVAAHRYTRRQRVARFARRHRAPLIVAALAAVGIAVLAWVSVHRILRERDTAEIASIEAERQRAFADQRAAEVRERADQLLLLYARSLLDANPTHAFAVLKQVEATTGSIREEAKALARAAYSRGVAWGLPTLPELITTLEMTRDGKRVVQMNRLGALQIVDLDTRRQIGTYEAPVASMARWVDQDRKVLINSRSSAFLLDATTLTAERLAVPPLTDFSISGDGSRVAAITDADELLLLDVATRQTTKVPMRNAVTDVLIAHDASWIACEETLPDKRKRAVVVDPTGRILLQRDGNVFTMGTSAGGKLAIAFSDATIEIASMTQPVLTEIPLSAEMRMVHHIMYRGERAHLVSYNAVFAWTGKQLNRVRELVDGAMLVKELRDGVLAITSNDGRIALLQGEVSHSLAVTSRPDGIVRIAASPGSSRVVATSKDALLLWDIDHLLPRPAPTISSPVFTSEVALASAAGLEPEWEWADVTNGTTRVLPLQGQPGIPRGTDFAPDDGRVLVLIEHQHQTTSAQIAYPDGRQVVVDGISVARLVEGGGLVYSSGKARVMGKVGTEEARELAIVDGDVIAVTRLGKLGYAALSAKGELVRGRFDGTQVSRTHVTDVDGTRFIEGEPDGGVLVALGNRLVRWPRAASPTSIPPIEDVARFKGAITWLHATPAGLYVGLKGNELMYLAPTGDRTPRHLPVGDRVAVSHDGSRVMSINGRNEIEVLELPSLVSWTLPRQTLPTPYMAISPTGRRIYVMVGGAGMLWTLPEPGSDFAAWLDEVTNATDVDRHVHWPWQAGAP